MRNRYSVRIDSNFDFPSVYTPHNAYNNVHQDGLQFQ